MPTFDSVWEEAEKLIRSKGLQEPYIHFAKDMFYGGAYNLFILLQESPTKEYVASLLKQITNIVEGK